MEKKRNDAGPNGDEEPGHKKKNNGASPEDRSPHGEGRAQNREASQLGGGDRPLHPGVGHRHKGGCEHHHHGTGRDHVLTPDDARAEGLDHVVTLESGAQEHEYGNQDSCRERAPDDTGTLGHAAHRPSVVGPDGPSEKQPRTHHSNEQETVHVTVHRY